MRFELTTLTLARLCSTPELRPHFSFVRRDLGLNAGQRKTKITRSLVFSQHLRPSRSRGR